MFYIFFCSKIALNIRLKGVLNISVIKKGIIHLRASLRIIILLAVACFIIIGILAFFYKSAYIVTYNGEFIGYSDNKSKLQEKINNFNKVQELKEEPKRFKNSSVISPVFGIKSDNEYKKLEAYKSSNVRNIEDEIKKTEEFLSELKKLKERIEK